MLGLLVAMNMLYNYEYNTEVELNKNGDEI